MSWINVTSSSLATILSNAELNKFQTALTGSLPSTFVDDIIQETVSYIRGYIPAAYKNEVDIDEAKIPQSLLRPTLQILAVRLGERLGGKIIDIDNRRDSSYKEAMELFSRVAAGKFQIEKSINPNTGYSEKDTAYAGTDNDPLDW